MPSILFIASHRLGRSPNQRYRFEQYLPALQKAGFHTEISFLIDEGMDRALYAPGHKRKKAKFLIDSYRIRRNDVKRMNDFDIIFICREALMTGSTRFEESFKGSGARIIYDLDDAIWLRSVSAANKRWSFLKNPTKTHKLMALAHLVIAGNELIAQRASRCNAHVVVVPSTIDMAQYPAKPLTNGGPVCIGWTGSHTTLPHFKQALPVLREIQAKFGSKVKFALVGDATLQIPEIGLQGSAWNEATEAADLHRFDIGIMPLPDDEWSKAKCGMKGLQYMALGIPPVMERIGVNTSIVEEGVNGFLASDPAEWLNKLCQLIEDAELRRRLGNAARITVEQKYSMQAWEQRYVKLFLDQLEQNKGS